MGRNFHFGVFLIFLAGVIVFTNPFTSDTESRTLKLLKDFNKISEVRNFDSLSASEQEDLLDKYVYLAKKLAQHDRYDEAIELLNRVLKLNPEYENIYNSFSAVYLARASYKSGNNTEKILASDDFKKALEYSKKNVAIFKDSPRSYDALINAYVYVGDFDSAIKTSKNACYTNSKFKNLCNKVSDLYLMQGKMPQAVEFYKDLVVKFETTNTSWIYSKIGTIYHNYGVCSEASKYFKLAYKTHPTAENLQMLTESCYSKI